MALVNIEHMFWDVHVSLEYVCMFLLPLAVVTGNLWLLLFLLKMLTVWHQVKQCTKINCFKK